MPIWNPSSPDGRHVADSTEDTSEAPTLPVPPRLRAAHPRRGRSPTRVFDANSDGSAAAGSECDGARPGASRGPQPPPRRVCAKRLNHHVPHAALAKPAELGRATAHQRWTYGRTEVARRSTVERHDGRLENVNWGRRLSHMSGGDGDRHTNAPMRSTKCHSSCRYSHLAC